jgi:phosphatidylserine/phosphatidylglycerophosphate/cardiolipin synthase-like enzyme/uncharacterized membrane protein YdjX (TVP38/TMEM64 family)
MMREHTHMRNGGLFAPGRNCWRIEHADRLAFLIDGAEYFAAVRSAIAQARHSVFILAWDFDSRTRLMPQGAGDGYPEELGEFLKEVVARQRKLHMYVLSWDFVFVFAGNREFIPLYKLGWRVHPRPRLSFRLDAKHPFSGSHHQKIVVVDDTVAFCGGLDLTHGRWDTPEHLRDQPYRTDMHGNISRPNHDVQAIVGGAAARALGELCRDRWYRATNHRAIPVDEAPLNDPWPHGLAPEITDIDVAIARTDPGYVTGQAVEEIHHLYVDAIAAAKRTLYLENQYFSSSAVGVALAARLRAQDAPEVVVVSRKTEEGWLEQETMGVLRARLHKVLQEADGHDRYRLLYPRIPDLDPAKLLNVHSKVLVVDDELCSVGSANFNNRSMGFDTECNIAIEARGEERIRRVIAGLRDRLLAEHLETQPEAVESALALKGGSLIGAIDALKHPGRTLEPINPTMPAHADSLVSARELIDPERPVDAQQLIEQFVPQDARKPIAGRVARFAAALLAVAALATAWRWTPLHDWIPLQSLLMRAQDIAGSPLAALWMLAVYILGGLLIVPITVLIVATGVFFGPLVGAVYAFGGVLLNAAVTYWIGQRLGRDTVRRLAGNRLNPIMVRLTKQGMLSVARIRLLALGSFSVVNTVAGASHVRLRDFLLGTAIGMAPGIVLMMVFADRLSAAITYPGLGTVAMLGVVTAIFIGGSALVWRRFSAPPRASSSS